MCGNHKAADFESDVGEGTFVEQRAHAGDVLPGDGCTLAVSWSVAGEAEGGGVFVVAGDLGDGAVGEGFDEVGSGGFGGGAVAELAVVAVAPG